MSRTQFMYIQSQSCLQNTLHKITVRCERKVRLFMPLMHMALHF